MITNKYNIKTSHIMHKYIVHAVLFFIAFLWAANYSIAKDVMPMYIRPYGLVTIRIIIAAVIFSIIHFFVSNEKVLMKDHFTLFICSMFGIAINTLLFFKGLSLSPPISAALIMTTTPIIILILSAISLKEKITVKKLLGIISAGGSVLYLLFDGLSFNFTINLGCFLLLLNAISYGLHLIILKPLTTKYSSLTIIKWTFLYAVFMVLPFGFNDIKIIDWAVIPEDVWYSIVFVIICATILTYLLTMWAIRHVNASVVGIYSYVQPFLATIIAVSLGKDTLTISKIIIGFFIFIGVYLVSVSELPKYK